MLNVVTNNFIGLQRSDRLNWLKCTNKTNCNLIIFIVPDPCSRNPCYNDGVCRGLGASYTCSCPMGYLGKTCQSMFNLYRKIIPQCKIMTLIILVVWILHVVKHRTLVDGPGIAIVMIYREIVKSL